MEDVTGWYSSSVRKEVYTSSATQANTFTERFQEWLKHRSGKVSIQLIEAPVPLINYKKKIYFSDQADLVDFLLSFEEMPTITDVDAAAFYAPYVPLTVSNVSGNNGVLGPNIISFNTRYGLVNSTSNTDGDI